MKRRPGRFPLTVYSLSFLICEMKTGTADPIVPSALLLCELLLEEYSKELWKLSPNMCD